MARNSLGKVVAVSMSGKSGVPKYPQAQVTVGTYGIEGDYHSGPINKHKREGPPEPNRRQVSIVSKEVLDSVNKLLGIDLKAGSLGENILVEGLGDLSDLQPGEKLQLGNQVLLEITSQNHPCATLEVHHPDMVKQLENKRGLTAVVIETGTVKPGDTSRVVS